jgi:hypothetical protein
MARKKKVAQDGKTKKPHKATPKAAPAEERGRGRPTLFKPEYVEQVRELCNRGATDANLADHFGVSIRTISNWQAQNADFLQALKEGKKKADERVERSLYLRATGYSYDAVKIFMPAGATEPVYAEYREHVPPDTTAMIFWLKNRCPQEWRDKLNHELGGLNGGPAILEVRWKEPGERLGSDGRPLPKEPGE